LWNPSPFFSNMTLQKEQFGQIGNSYLFLFKMAFWYATSALSGADSDLVTKLPRPLLRMSPATRKKNTALAQGNHQCHGVGTTGSKAMAFGRKHVSSQLGRPSEHALYCCRMTHAHHFDQLRDHRLALLADACNASEPSPDEANEDTAKLKSIHSAKKLSRKPMTTRPIHCRGEIERLKK
jgi:hypothetical protein